MKTLTIHAENAEKNTTYTAEEQKYTYEVQKCYIEINRVLCPECYKKYNVLKKQIKEYESLWAKETEESKKSALYLKEWLSVINEIPLYGKPKNEAMANNLQNLINKNA